MTNCIGCISVTNKALPEQMAVLVRPRRKRIYTSLRLRRREPEASLRGVCYVAESVIIHDLTVAEPFRAVVFSVYPQVVVFHIPGDGLHKVPGASRELAQGLGFSILENGRR